LKCVSGWSLSVLPGDSMDRQLDGGGCTGTLRAGEALGVAGCIMGMPESGSLEIPEGRAVRLFAGGAGAAASVM